MERRGTPEAFRVKTESVRKLSNFNFQWALNQLNDLNAYFEVIDFMALI